MRLFLTSYDLKQYRDIRYPGYPIYTHSRGLGCSADGVAAFDGMPPVCIDAQAGFAFDYSPFLLAEAVVVDKWAFRMMDRGAHAVAFGPLGEALAQLQAEGLVDLVDFVAILNDNAKLIHDMVCSDLANAERWLSPLQRSLRIWARFRAQAKAALKSSKRLRSDPFLPGASLVAIAECYAHGFAGRMETLLLRQQLSPNARRTEFTQPFSEVLHSYLRFVNVNVVLARETGAGIYDWSDYGPFYHEKFRGACRDLAAINRPLHAVRSLFRLSFPHYAIHDPKTLMRILKDKRLDSLRHLVQECVDGRVRFDRQFAEQTLTEVLRRERRIAKWRNIASYVTFPLNFIPFVGSFAQKAAEEAAGWAIAHKSRRDYQWFYMLSEAVDQPKHAGSPQP